MEISLPGALRRWLFLVASLLLAGTIIFAAGKLWLAEHLSESPEPKDWLRAVQLEPGNADYWYQVGRFRHWDFQQANLRQAISYYQRASEINPQSATYWLDLAAAYEMVGEIPQAREAFARARATYPISAEVAWNYGNFLLRQKEFPEAFVEIRRAVTVDPHLTYPAVLITWRASGDAKRILDEVLPHQSSSYFEALNCFLSKRELNPALAVWDRLVAMKEPLEMQQALPLLEELIQQDRTEEAKQVWRQALGISGWQEDESAEASLIWNGGFERALINGGFDWRELPIAGATFDLDTTTYHSGSRSLRINFDGTANLDFRHLVQYVPAEPGRRYLFTAFLRTEGISTDSGIRFSILAPRQPTSLNLLTPGLVGSNPWSPQAIEFTTGLETHWLVISLRRIPSGKIDNKLQGTAWVDDVSLIAVSAHGLHPAP